MSLDYETYTWIWDMSLVYETCRRTMIHVTGLWDMSHEYETYCWSMRNVRWLWDMSHHYETRSQSRWPGINSPPLIGCCVDGPSCWETEPIRRWLATADVANPMLPLGIWSTRKYTRVSYSSCLHGHHICYEILRWSRTCWLGWRGHAGWFRVGYPSGD